MRPALPLIVALAVGLLAAPLPAAAQELKPKRIGVVFHGGHYYANVEGLRVGLKAAGLEEGRHIVLVLRDLEGNPDAAEAVARDLERDGVDLIVVMATIIARAAKRATVAVPIVFAAGADPVAFRLVDSIARPGGRLTGVHFIAADLTAKRLEILRELMPTLRRVFSFHNPGNPVSRSNIESARDAARQLGVALVERQVTSPQDIEQSLRDLSAADADAYFHVPDGMVMSQIAPILERTTALRMPAMLQEPDLVRTGALAAYGISFHEVGRTAATYVARILSGARPSELPVEAVSRIVLSINLKTAAALGITIPPAMLLRAEEVIE